MLDMVFNIEMTYQTGLEKPHTIQIEGGRLISIVYYGEKYIPADLEYIAMAKDAAGKEYKLFTSSDFRKALAVPVK